MSTEFARLLSLAAMLLTVVPIGCSTPRRQVRESADRPAETLFMEPLHIGLAPDPDLGITDFDASTLFHEGLRYHEAERFAQALKFYERLIREFPDSRYLSAAAFNAGRCLERLGRVEQAAQRYRLITDGLERSKDWVDAMFRLVACLTDLGHDGQAKAELERLLERDSLSVSDRIDGTVLLGEGYTRTGELLRAERAFRQALKLHRAHEREAYLDPAPAARAEFRLAGLAAERFLAAPLRLPEARMQSDLEAKASLLLTAQAGFLRSMRLGDPEWATASGYRIGKLYLDLHRAMERAPVPEDLGPEEVEVYRDLLRRRLAVLLRKALGVFEMTMQLAQRAGENNVWTQAAKEEMERVERQVLSLLESLPDAERQGRPPPAQSADAPDRS